MPESDDHQLLAEFASAGSEPAFATLVERYVNLVHSTAFRSTGNAQNAEEITQTVFIILARKAKKLSPRVVLSGWLYQTTRLTAANFMKGEFRWRRRQEEAAMQSILNEPTESAWREIAPLLDEAMGCLGQTDRDALVLRYFENKTAAEIGAVLRMNEDTARRRVNRALEKLRRIFLKCGVASTTATIGQSISANSVQAAPVALAKKVTAAAITKGAAASASTLTLMKGVLKIMAWTKTKTAIVAGVAVILAAGAGLQTLATIKKHLLQQAAAKQIVVPGGAWNNAGQNEPKATLTTFLWAASQGDGKMILDSFTPDGRQHWQKNFEKQMRQEGKSLDQIMAQEVPIHFSLVMKQGFTIVDQQTNAAGQMLLHLQVQGDPKPRAFWFKNIDGEWKIYNFE